MKRHLHILLHVPRTVDSSCTRRGVRVPLMLPLNIHVAEMFEILYKFLMWTSENSTIVYFV